MGDPPPSRPPCRSLVSGSFNDERPFFRVYEGATDHFWRKADIRENTHRTVASIATNPSRTNCESHYGQRFSARISLSIFVRVTAASREASSPCAFRQSSGNFSTRAAFDGE